MKKGRRKISYNLAIESLIDYLYIQYVQFFSTCSFEKQKIEDKTRNKGIEDKTRNKRLGTKSKSNCEQKNTWEIEISHATYYSDLIYRIQT